jgi:hypothetical protein
METLYSVQEAPAPNPNAGKPINDLALERVIFIAEQVDKHKEDKLLENYQREIQWAPVLIKTAKEHLATGKDIRLFQDTIFCYQSSHELDLMTVNRIVRAYNVFITGTPKPGDYVYEPPKRAHRFM